MEDYSKLSVEELNKLDKKSLISIIVSQQEQLAAINKQLQYLTDQVKLMNQRAFGRKTEKLDQIPGQEDLFEYFNEPEAFSDDSPEPDIKETVVSGYTRKKKTTREQNLEGLPTRTFEHTLSEEELNRLFPDGYKELPPETYKRLSVIPQTFFVDEHHVHVYASKKNDGTIVKADRPKDLFRNSIATPSLVAMIIHAKYTNHVPLERQHKCYEDNGVNLEVNTMANWMMNAADLYLNTIYEEMHKQLLDCKIVHADETPLQVIRDGRPAGSESRMWVYCSNTDTGSPPITLFDYEKTRKAEHPDRFLAGYTGTLVTDGYQVYHTLDKQRDDMKVAGCWIHARRRLSDHVKSKTDENSIAAEGVSRISRIFHLDDRLKNLSSEERQKQRMSIVKPKVDAYFAWAKKAVQQLDPGSKLAKDLQYGINQEPFLRLFLTDGDIPLSNNTAEIAIRPFTVGRKNWVNIDTIRGAETSAILYSIVETARANHLRVCDYLELLLTELPKHEDDTSRDFIQDLLPWSENIQKKCGARENS